MVYYRDESARNRDRLRLTQSGARVSREGWVTGDGVRRNRDSVAIPGDTFRAAVEGSYDAGVWTIPTADDMAAALRTSRGEGASLLPPQ